MSDFNTIDSYLEKNLDKSIAELSKLVAQPSISAQGIGLKECAHLVADMLRARGFTKWVSSQPQYSLVWREPEDEVVPLCAANGVSQIVWSPLGQGGQLLEHSTQDGPLKGRVQEEDRAVVIGNVAGVGPTDVADLRNSTGRAAGTITAAHFLREFVEDTPWAHLDIAGVAWQGEKKAHLAKGPSGFGVRTLVNYVASHDG